jgi:hypothetical protein
MARRLINISAPLRNNVRADPVPSAGFTVCCFPTKIERASAGWTRAAAIIDG